MAELIVSKSQAGGETSDKIAMPLDNIDRIELKHSTGRYGLYMQVFLTEQASKEYNWRSFYLLQKDNPKIGKKIKEDILKFGKLEERGTVIQTGYTPIAARWKVKTLWIEDIKPLFQYGKIVYICKHCRKPFKTIRTDEFEGEEERDGGVGDCCIDSPSYYESEAQ